MIMLTHGSSSQAQSENKTAGGKNNHTPTQSHPKTWSKPFRVSDSYVGVGIMIDCYHDFNQNIGGTQGCLNLRGMRINIVEQVNEKIRAQIRINPLGSPNKAYELTPFTENIPQNKDFDLSLFDSYKLSWDPRKNLSIAIESYHGATKLPQNHDLSMIGSLDNAGWDQLALTLTSDIPFLEHTTVKFSGGSGEGEVIKNSDPQQYFGFELHTEFYKGLVIHSGISVDGNHSGSLMNTWFRRSLENEGEINFPTERLGFTNKRMSLAFELNGNLEAARGLKADIGWQEATYSDLNKDRDSLPSLEDLEQSTNLSHYDFFFEDPSHKQANSVKHKVLSIASSYRILDTYFLGAYYQNKLVSSDTAFFKTCRSISNNICNEESGAGKRLNLWSYGIGAGLHISEQLKLSLEYSNQEFAHLYKAFNFNGRNGTKVPARDVFNARISYNWQ